MIEILSAVTIGWIVCGILAACVIAIWIIVFYIIGAPSDEGEE
jgi:hypothetical protein